MGRRSRWEYGKDGQVIPRRQPTVCSNASDWLRRLSGRRTYERIWRPLLLAKLGQNHERVSAVFIWSYIKRLFAARDPSTQKEQLGYVCGGYRTVVKRIEQQVRSGGGTIHSGVAVRRIAPAPSGGLVGWLLIMRRDRAADAPITARAHLPEACRKRRCSSAAPA